MAEMNEPRIHEWLFQQVLQVSELLKEGRYNEIDLSAIEREATDLARNFSVIIDSLESTKSNLSHTLDVPLITDNLQYISQTTAAGVSKVIDYSEAIINDAGAISTVLHRLQARPELPPAVRGDSEEIAGHLTSMQNNAFTIMTSLEFEDINRQLIEKILKRLNELYESLLKVLIMLKIKDKLARNETTFIADLKKVADISEDTAHKQDTIDQLLREFGL